MKGLGEKHYAEGRRYMADWARVVMVRTAVLLASVQPVLQALDRLILTTTLFLSPVLQMRSLRLREVT